MARDIKSRVIAVTRDLKTEIAKLERELAEKREVLHALTRLKGGPLRRSARPVAGYGRKTVTRKIARGRKAMPIRRKSKNRDALISAAKSMKGTFELKDLLKKAIAKDSTFGGKNPSTTALAVLKTTPEIRKVRRGLYQYRG